MKDERLASVTFANYITLLKLTKQRNPVQMMCYKDRTFCITSYTDGCGNTKCDRNFSEEERTKAVEWWGGDDYPVAMGFFKSDECGFISTEIKGDELLEKLD